MEWSNEFESRLCISLEKPSERKALPVYLPPDVIESMSFTFSPWLERDMEVYVEGILKDVLKFNRKDVKGKKRQSTPFHRSTLQGALNFA